MSKDAFSPDTSSFFVCEWTQSVNIASYLGQLASSTQNGRQRKLAHCRRLSFGKSWLSLVEPLQRLAKYQETLAELCPIIIVLSTEFLITRICHIELFVNIQLQTNLFYVLGLPCCCVVVRNTVWLFGGCREGKN